MMARPEGFEPSTRHLENDGSILLSYGRMAEAEGIEPSRPLLTDCGLASRSIATLASFHLAGGVGIEPTCPGSQNISVFKTGALPLCQPPLTWCPTRDSNSENLVSKTSAYAIPPAGPNLVGHLGLEPREELLLREARLPFRQWPDEWWSGLDSNQNGTSRPMGYSRVLYRMSVRSKTEASITRSSESGA